MARILEKVATDMGLELEEAPEIIRSAVGVGTVRFFAFACSEGRPTYFQIDLYIYWNRAPEFACMTSQVLLDELEKHIYSELSLRRPYFTTYAPALDVLVFQPLVYEKLTDERYMRMSLKSVVNKSLDRIEKAISRGIPPLEEPHAIQADVVYHFKSRFPIRPTTVAWYLRWYLKHIKSLYEPLCSSGLLLLLLPF